METAVTHAASHLGMAPEKVGGLDKWLVGWVGGGGGAVGLSVFVRARAVLCFFAEQANMQSVSRARICLDY